MKSKDIEVGGIYAAKVSNQVVPLRVLRTEERQAWSGRSGTIWICRNVKTGRQVIVKSAQRFRRPVSDQQDTTRPAIPKVASCAIWVPADGCSYDD